MRRLRPLILICFGIAVGCSTHVAHTERDIARHLNQSITLEGEYQLVGHNEAIRNDWGTVIVQRKDSQGIAPGSYVRGTGVIARGHLANGEFVADVKDEHGMRTANDLVLRNAHVQAVPRPSTQPMGWEMP